MNTELIDVSATNKEIRIEVSPDEVRQVYDKVSKKYAGQAKKVAAISSAPNRLRCSREFWVILGKSSMCQAVSTALLYTRKISTTSSNRTIVFLSDSIIILKTVRFNRRRQYRQLFFQNDGKPPVLKVLKMEVLDTDRQNCRLIWP